MKPSATGRTGCERVQDRLERYVDGTLAPLERALDRGHLEACAGCAVELERWEALVGALPEALQPRADELERALQGVARRLAEAPAPRFRWRHLPGRVLVPLATAAAAVLLLLALQWAGGGLRGMAPVRSSLLVPELDLRLPAWSDVVGNLWTRGEAR